MERIHIGDLKGNIGKKVKIAGFIQIIRDQGSIKFLIIRDVTGVVQVVVLKKNAEAMDVAHKLSHESVVEIEGLLKEEAQAPGGFEVSAEKISVLSDADPELPIPVYEKGQEEADQSVRMDWRWIDLRKPKNVLIFKVWTEMEAAFREFWTKNNYIEIHSPKIIGTPSESGAEVFKVDYFGREAFLAQSPQFYKQMAMAAGFEKVFEVGPVFRAEPSFTSRHATEFTGYDTEISYVNSHEDVMAEEEKVIAFVIKRIKEKFGDEIKEVFGKEIAIPKTPFPRITISSAKEILKKMGISGEKEGDLSSEEEKKISEHMKEESGHEFLFVTDYPLGVRPFYHMRHEDNPKLTKSFDLLWNGLEVTTGAQREHRYEILTNQAKEKGMSLGALKFYLNFFKYGCPPHGGYGMGPNRMLMKLLDLENVRNAMFLYRGVNRLLP